MRDWPNGGMVDHRQRSTTLSAALPQHPGAIAMRLRPSARSSSSALTGSGKTAIAEVAICPFTSSAALRRTCHPPRLPPASAQIRTACHPPPSGLLPEKAHPALKWSAARDRTQPCRTSSHPFFSTAARHLPLAGGRRPHRVHDTALGGRRLQAAFRAQHS